MSQCCTSPKIADKHRKGAKKTGSVERAQVWVHGDGVSQHWLFSVLSQTRVTGGHGGASQSLGSNCSMKKLVLESTSKVSQQRFFRSEDAKLLCCAHGN